MGDFHTDNFIYEERIIKVMRFKHGINKQIMNSMTNQLLENIEIYSKLLLVRFDVRTYSMTPNNNIISKFKKYALSYLANHYRTVAAFFWVREQTKNAEQAHYHCYVLVSGHKAKAWGVNRQLIQARDMLPDMDIWFPENAGYLIRRNNPESLVVALYRISYLAKNYSKELTPRKVKRYQSSSHSPRIK